MQEPPGRSAPHIFIDAFSYVVKVKDRFLCEPAVYDQFIAILVQHANDSSSLRDVYGRVVDLLTTEPDLIQGFEQFLPPALRRHRAPS